ncbi:MAG: carbon monoxide dehydrogenase E protein, partial [uncultured Solirubrobacteraceae bacterium]
PLFRSPHPARGAAHGRRAAAPRAPRPGPGPAAARPPARRVGVHGALRADAPAVRAGRRGGPAAGGGLRLRHAPDPAHRGAAPARPRRGARAGERRDRRLVRRHPDRREPRGPAPHPRAPARARGGGGHPLGRVGPRGARGPRRGDGPPAPQRAPGDLAQPAQGRPGLRAARARDGCGPAARRPLPGGPLAALARGAGRPARSGPGRGARAM